MKKDKILDFLFSDYLNSFHLCGVDLCYKMQDAGLYTYVIPLEVWHKSSGA